MKYEFQSNEDFKIVDIDKSDLQCDVIGDTKYPAFIMVDSGEVELEVNMHPFRLLAGNSIMVIPPEFLNVRSCTDAFAGKLLIVKPTLFSEALSRLELFTIREFFKGRLNANRDEIDNEIKDFFVNTIRNISVIYKLKDDKYKYELVMCQLRSLFCYVANRIESWYKSQSNHTPDQRSFNRMEEHFRKFMEFVVKYYKTSREVAFYADKLNLTPKYLNYITTTLVNRTCKQIINNYVIVQIKNDLRYSSKSIQEIAYDYNFANQSFLGSFFKKMVGVSPRKFRNDKNG